MWGSPYDFNHLHNGRHPAGRSTKPLKQAILTSIKAFTVTCMMLTEGLEVVLIAYIHTDTTGRISENATILGLEHMFAYMPRNGNDT